MYFEEVKNMKILITSHGNSSCCCYCCWFMGWESTGSTFTMKVVPVNSIKCNHILSIPSSLYIGQKLPGSGCTFKMQVVPGNFFPIYRELGIARNLCHFQNLAKSFQKMPNSDSWQFLAFLQWAGNCQEPLFLPIFWRFW